MIEVFLILLAFVVGLCAGRSLANHDWLRTANIQTSAVVCDGVPYVAVRRSDYDKIRARMAAAERAAGLKSQLEPQTKGEDE